MRRDWHRDRFTPSSSCVEVTCTVCERHYWLPPSKVNMHRRCSAECRKVHEERLRNSRQRDCATCGEVFTARGAARFCSQACNTSGATTFRALAGRTGEQSPRWRGGRSATYRRRVAAGKVAAYRRRNAGRLMAREAAYHAAYPEVRKSVKARRRARLRSASGTHSAADIRELMRLQRCRCAVCRESIRLAYHVDHVIALANGGTNDKTNLQLLCGPCNRHKHTKDPLRFMQERGFLL